MSQNLVLVFDPCQVFLQRVDNHAGYGNPLLGSLLLDSLPEVVRDTDGACRGLRGVRHPAILYAGVRQELLKTAYGHRDPALFVNALAIYNSRGYRVLLLQGLVLPLLYRTFDDQVLNNN